MITIEYMALAGRCNNHICARDKRDGEEVSCIQMDPWSVHPNDNLCKNCKHWAATPEKQQRIIVEDVMK